MRLQRYSSALLRRAGGRDLSERPRLHEQHVDQQPVAGRSARSRLNQLLGRRRKSVIVLVVASTLSGIAEAATLALIALVAADVVGTKATSERTSIFHSLIGANISTWTLIFIAFGFATVRLLLQFPISILPARVAADVQARVRAGLFDAFTHASWSIQSRDREGQLQETMTSQAMQATTAALNITALVSSACSFLALLATALFLNLVAAAVVLAVVLGLFATLRPLRGAGTRRARALSKAQIKYAAGVAESNSVAEETHVFGASEAQRRQIDVLIAKASELFFETQALIRVGQNVSQSLIYVLLIAALAGLHALGGSHTASLGAVVLILVRASSGAQSVQSAYQGLVQAMPFVERVQDAEARYRASTQPGGERALSEVRSLGFRGVSYAYHPGTPVLRDITFEVEGGEVVGVIGPSGAGKSTLVQLLLRLRVPDEGQYLVNGAPAQEFRREDWNQRVSYVPQEPRLLHASVADNIRYFRDLDDDAVERAGRLARIHEDVISWKDGYETIVGPRADAVSGGQRQRICLARALVARPQVLVLDEPTSALDPRSETLIQESLTGLKSELTLFIVAHRMSTLDICDRVMVVTDGQLAAFDTIDHLRRHNSYYRSASALAIGGTQGGAEEIDGRDSASLGQTNPLGVAPVRARAAAAPRGRMPDFFIVGHPKCGTTALYEMLRRHSEIYMPVPRFKEPEFFASEMYVGARPKYLPATLEEYLALFADAGADQLVGEASTSYLRSHTAANNIAEVQPDARIIAILREPASLLRSVHLQYVQAVMETEYDLRRALALEEERRQGRNLPRHGLWPLALQYSEHVRYVEQLRRYYAAFGKDNVLVLIYDDFRTDNESTMRAVLRFLDVDASAPIAEVEANPTVAPRSQAVHELMHTVTVGRGPISRGVKGAVKALTPQETRRRALQAVRRTIVYGAPPAADAELMSELRNRFKGEVQALSVYLGRDLVGLWGYDDID